MTPIMDSRDCIYIIEQVSPMEGSQSFEILDLCRKGSRLGAFPPADDPVTADMEMFPVAGLSLTFRIVSPESPGSTAAWSVVASG